MFANKFQSGCNLERELNKYKYIDVSSVPLWLHFQFSLFNVTLLFIPRTKEETNFPTFSH